jgi:hypothetical protein
MPCTYAPDDCASAHLGFDRFVTRFGSESGSTMVTIRRSRYAGSARIALSGSMYSAR